MTKQKVDFKLMMRAMLIQGYVDEIQQLKEEVVNNKELDVADISDGGR